MFHPETFGPDEKVKALDGGSNGAVSDQGHLRANAFIKIYVLTSAQAKVQ